MSSTLFWHHGEPSYVLRLSSQSKWHSFCLVEHHLLWSYCKIFFISGYESYIMELIPFGFLFSYLAGQWSQILCKVSWERSGCRPSFSGQFVAAELSGICSHPLRDVTNYWAGHHQVRIGTCTLTNTTHLQLPPKLIYRKLLWESPHYTIHGWILKNFL